MSDHATHPEPSARMPDEADDSLGADVEWLVDGYNVIQVTLLGGADRAGWWKQDARTRLLERARWLPSTLGTVWLVFDGPDPTVPVDERAPGPHTIFAPDADDWILRRVKRRREGATTVVVTADRRLADRCRHAGAALVTPGDFVARCKPVEADARTETPST